MNIEQGTEEQGSELGEKDYQLRKYLNIGTLNKEQKNKNRNWEGKGVKK